MSRLNLVIGDNDEAYLDSLVCFLIRDYSHRFKISSFSNQECLEKYLKETSERVDILLIGFALDSTSINKDSINCLIVLTEGSGENISHGSAVVNKYLQGDKLVGFIMNFFSEKSNSELNGPGMGKKTRVVSVFSPQGGSGKTCIALSACIQCARKGLKVFYLNLEDFNSTSTFFDCNNDSNFSSIIYYLKDKSKNLPMKIEASRCIDPVWGIHYFSPPESDTEINEITCSELKELVNSMISLKIYDFIIIDMSSNFGERNMERLRLSDEIVLTLDGNLCGKVKYSRFMADFGLFIQKDSKEYENKLSVVLNKYKQKIHSDFEFCFSEINLIRIPEINDFEWTAILHMAKMDSDYVEAIDKLIHKWTIFKQL